MRVRPIKESQAFAYEVVEYYEKVNRSRRKTYDYYLRVLNKPPKTIYNILKRYNSTGNVEYKKQGSRNRAPVTATPAKLEQLKKLMELDPYISVRDAGHMLKLKTSSISILKRKLKSMEEQKSRAIWSQQKDSVAITGEHVFGTGEDKEIADCEDHFDDNSETPNDSKSDFVDKQIGLPLEESCGIGITLGSAGIEFQGTDTIEDLWKASASTLSPKSKHFPNEGKVSDEILEGPGSKRTKQTDSKICDVSQCFICLNSLPNKTRKRKMSMKPGSIGGEKLNENLDLILLLKILNITSDKLVYIMKEAQGTAPKDWLGLCTNCGKLVQDALFVWKQIQTLEQKLLKTKFKIVEKIRSSRKNAGGKKKKKGKTGNDTISTIVRESALENKVCSPPPNPFLMGDQEAEKKVQLMKVNVKMVPEKVGSNEILVKQEATNDWLDQDHDEDDIFNPLSPSYSEHEEPVQMKVEMQSNETGSAKNILSISPLPEDGKASGRAIMTQAYPTENVIETQSEPELVSCDVCAVRLKPITLPMHKLKEHEIVMEGFTKKECSVTGCYYVTLYDDHFELHKERHTIYQNTPNTLACSFCGKPFNHYHKMKLHEDRHRNRETKPYQCDLCGKDFALRQYLNIHKKWHQGTLPPSFHKRRMSKKKNK